MLDDDSSVGRLDDAMFIVITVCLTGRGGRGGEVSLCVCERDRATVSQMYSVADGK